MFFVTRGLLSAGIAVLAASAAHAASVKEVFEAHDLLGTWAMDCNAQPSAQNPYVVFRPVETYVQRDTMASATERSDVSVIDLAEDRKPDEIMMRMVSDQRRLTLVVQLEPKRMRTIEIARDGGEKLVADGRLVANGAEVPWTSRCSP